MFHLPGSTKKDDKGTTIPNNKNFRDLGTHLNCTKSSNGVTLTQRMKKTTAMARRLAWMPLDAKTKETIVMCNILPAALYGVEAAHVNKQE